ncbi:MAG: helix-turn-helix domain-containing protein [Muribaculaceae bacterium]|nr:helix-turn-helix domain-containing protein [Muribaculaceae bacterium]
MSEVILIKNMVCRHCITAVQSAFEKAGIPVDSIELGKALMSRQLSPDENSRLEEALHDLGFEIISGHEEAIVEAAKRAIMHHVRSESECRFKLSSCIEKQLGLPYSNVSRIFSRLEGRTLEKYHIAQKVERVKELLQGGEHTLEEIADMAGYSSAAHLSRQFKAVTGMSPTRFIQTSGTRKPLNEI